MYHDEVSTLQLVIIISYQDLYLTSNILSEFQKPHLVVHPVCNAQQNSWKQREAKYTYIEQFN